MERLRPAFGACGLVALLVFASCDVQLTSSSSNSNHTSGTGSATSVSDVTSGSGGEGGTEFPLPSDAIRSRVRNESSSGADITMKFRRDGEIVHIAFVRVVPGTITTVTSPEMARSVELTGLDGKGHALADKIFNYGVDFQDGVPAEYVIRDPAQPPSGGGPPPQDNPDGSDGGNDGTDTGGTPPDPTVPPDPTPTPGGGSSGSGPPPVELSLRLLEPATNVTVLIGSTVAVQWDDAGGSTSAKVRIYLRAMGDSNQSNWTGLSAEIGAALDGLNDQIEALIADIDAGEYEVVGVLSDSGAKDIIAIAPGHIIAKTTPRNVAPSITLSSQNIAAVRNGESIQVQWTDDDPDDDAQITFTLVSEDSSETGGNVFTFTETFDEDPEGPQGDSAQLAIDGVIPGLYTLVATINDGELSGSDRLTSAVYVLPDRQNDPPKFEMLEPAVDVDGEDGFAARWTDSDDNDNAQISLLLDPDWRNVPLDGDEYLLAGSIAEDPDGSADEMQLQLPTRIPNGVYALVAVINDGLVQVMVRAPGLVYVGRSTDDESGTPGPGGTIGDDVGATPLGTITTLELADYVVDGTSDPLSVHIVYSGELPSRQQLFLTNVAYGGETRIDVTPVAAIGPAKNVYYAVSLNSVPNEAWPRSFDLETQLVYSNGAISTFRSMRPIWIRQQVEIVSAEMIRYSCPISGGTSDAPPFSGLQITWYGGGFQETDSTQVQFWLSKDGVVPQAQLSDPRHRLLGQAPASPNLQRTIQIPIALILGSGGVADAPPDGGVASIAEHGDYRLFNVYAPFETERLTSPAYPDLFRLCGAIPVAANTAP